MRPMRPRQVCESLFLIVINPFVHLIFRIAVLVGCQFHDQPEINEPCVICQKTASRRLKDSQLRDFTEILNLQHPALFQRLLLACFQEIF